MEKMTAIKNVYRLNKSQQKSIQGGAIYCESHTDCPGGYGCCYTQNLCRTDEYIARGFCDF